MEYQDKFDALLNRVVLTEEYAISCFLSGLKDEIQIPVRMFQPRSLQRALSLAKLQELAVDSRNKLYKGGIKPMTGNLPTLPTSRAINNPNISQPARMLKNPSQQGLLGAGPMATKPARNISNTEFEERRAKGLCFWCEEKYAPGHQCKKKQLYKIELVEEEDPVETKSFEETAIESEVLIDAPQISLYALIGQSQPLDFRTMRLSGTAKNRRIHVLIDSGSSHNFLDSAIASKLGCHTEAVSPVKVTVADGNRLTSSAMCKGFKWKMQGVEFDTDLLLLPFKGCDMVLGIQWLIQLGPILWDFKQLRMEFHFRKRKVVLRGSPETSLKLIDRKELMKISQGNTSYSAVHLCSIHVSTQEMIQAEKVTAAETEWEGLDNLFVKRFQLLLKDYSDLFAEPQGLPPKRMQDHRIPLKDGANPVNVRPYRCSPAAKGATNCIYEQAFISKKSIAVSL
uniref:Retrotransposon gag domain-containing protein n=1 Tax=Ananas comosus var. bracteatus TaxID=296719 RepID=A0A6V7PPZ2_ANACO|nr:unnamed protein product [Ananas comosus var. bracteatus]